MKASNIAKLLLYWNTFNGDLPITNLKLQKLLYYAQGWSFVELKKELFEENIVAWKYGPVIKEIYNEYKQFKNLPIELNINSFNAIEKQFDKATIEYLKRFYNLYIDTPAHELVASSHQEKPWFFTFNMKGEGAIIEKDLIKEFFLEWENNAKNKN